MADLIEIFCWLLSLLKQILGCFIDAGFIDDITGKIKEFASSKFGA